MSKIDQKYIDALESFTDALETIVETLKEQQKNDKSDVVNELLKNTSDNFGDIVTELQEITKDTKYIKGNTDTILKELKALHEVQKINKSEIINIVQTSPTSNFDEVVKELQEIKKETGKIKDNTDNSVSEGIKELKEIKKDTLHIKNNTDTILKEIRAIKKAKETGMFDKVEDPKNKNKIVDGIKTVILIAAGVLAIGMAFKVIGKVDFKSVVALSAAMFLTALTYQKISEIKGLSYKNVFMVASILPIMALGLIITGWILKVFPKLEDKQMFSIVALSGAMFLAAMAFAKISKIKDLTYTKIFIVASMLPIMAFGLMLSGWILKSFPTFTLMQGISMLLVSGALGLATFLLLKGIGKLSAKSLLLVPLIPILLPLIALGLVKASKILKDVQPISLMQAFAIGLIGVALSVAIFGIGLALKGMKNITWKEMLMLPIMIPLIAGGIVIASKIFQNFVPIKNPLQLLLGSLVIGGAILIFTPVIYLLGKLTTEQLVRGGLGVLAVSGVILGTAWILSLLPSKMSYPDFMWTLGVGLSLTVFGLLVLGVGIVAEINPIGFLAGLLAVPLVAASMVGVSWLIQKGKWTDNYPSLGWALGVGSALVLFGGAVIIASVAGLAGAVAKFFSGEDPLIALTRSMVGVSFLLQQGNWTSGYPSLGWALGVGTALTLFAGATIIAAVGGLATSIIGFFSGDKDPLMTLTQSMVNVSHLLGKGDWSDNYPSFDWGKGVGTSLMYFAAVTVGAAAEGLVKNIFGFFSGDKDPLMTLAQSMVDVSIKLQEGKWDGNYPSLGWSVGVGVALSLFAAVTIMSAAGGLSKSILGFFSGDKDPLMTLTKSMVDVSHMLKRGDWSEVYPSLKWSVGVGIALTIFGKLTTNAAKTGFKTSILVFFSGDKDPLVTLTQSMVNVSLLLQKGKWNDNYPTLGWSLAVGKVLSVFGALTIAASLTGLVKSVFSFFSEDKDPLVTLTNSMVGVSLTLQKGKWNEMYPSLLWSTNVGKVLTIFGALAIMAEAEGLANSITSFFSGDKDPLLTLTQSMVNVSLALQKGKWNGTYPSILWATNISAVTAIFGALTLFAASNGMVKSIFEFFGIKDPLMTLVTSMVNVSLKLQQGVWNNKYPSEIWTKEVSSVLSVFGALTIMAGKTGLRNSIFALFTGDKDPLVTLATSLVEVSKVLSKGNWTSKYPNKDYAEGVGGLLVSMANAYKTMNSTGLFELLGNLVSKKVSLLDFAKEASTAIVSSSLILSKGNYSNFPDIKYTQSFSSFVVKMSDIIDDYDVDINDVNSFVVGMRLLIPSLISLANATQTPISDIFIQGFDKLVVQLNNLPDKSQQIRNLAASFRELSDSLKDIKSFDNLGKISAGIVLLSAVDDAKLQVILDKIKANEDTLKNVYGTDSNTSSALSTIVDFAKTAFSTEKPSEAEKESKLAVTDKRQDQFYDDITEIKSLLNRFLDQMDKPSNNGSFHK